MTKTGQQIEDDIYNLLCNSSLSESIGGKVYIFGMRPKDSAQEDAIVRFITGIDGDIQEGVIVVNIYVADFDTYGDGIKRKDVTRCAHLEIRAKEWVKSLTASVSNYRFKLAKTIYTEEEPDIKQHFISVKLKFKLSTF